MIWKIGLEDTAQHVDYATYLFPIVLSIYSLGLIIFVLGLCIRPPALINVGLLEVAIIAALKSFDPANFASDLNARYLVVAANEVVYNLLTGWFCGEFSRSHFFSIGVNTIPAFLLFGISALTLIFFGIITLLPTSLCDR